MASSAAPAPALSSRQRLIRVRELWVRSQKDQLEIGRLLYEERAERLGVGGRGDREGFHQWLREAGIPKTSAYRRISEYEISVGERTEDDPFDKPVPFGTTLNRIDSVPEPSPSVRPSTRVYPQEDYEPEQQVKAASSRSHGMGVDRLRKITAGRDGIRVSHDGEMFRVTVTQSFKTEKEARVFLETL